jgi:hypothetical protein
MLVDSDDVFGGHVRVLIVLTYVQPPDGLAVETGCCPPGVRPGAYNEVFVLVSKPMAI